LRLDLVMAIYDKLEIEVDAHIYLGDIMLIGKIVKTSMPGMHILIYSDMDKKLTAHAYFVPTKLEGNFDEDPPY